MSTNGEEVYCHRHASSPTVALIVGASLLALATIGFFTGGSRWLAAHASARWPETEGLIIESRVGSNCTLCRPTINYHYTVNNQSFVGSNLTAGPQDYYNRNAADVKVRSYVVGSKLAVYYDPKYPVVSCLEPGVLRWFAYLYFGFAVGLVSAGLFLFLRRYRSKPNART